MAVYELSKGIALFKTRTFLRERSTHATCRRPGDSGREKPSEHNKTGDCSTMTTTGQQTSVSRFFCPQARKRPRSDSIGRPPPQDDAIEITDDSPERQRTDVALRPAENDARDEDVTENDGQEREQVSPTKASQLLKENNEDDVNKESQDDASAVSQQPVNPFAKFAYSTTSSEQPPAAKKWTVSLNHIKSSSNKKQKKDTKDWVRMVDCSPEEQEKIRLKWHSLADSEAPIEVRRFQVLVAARLHARCQEPVVRKTMTALRQHLQAAGGDLDADTLAKSDPEGLAVILSSLQYYNVKAKHVVAAAKEIQSMEKVPETESSLKEITGIGPVMADLLAFVNTVAAHTQPNEKS